MNQLRKQTIIFDLGNVLLPIDFEKTYRCFELFGLKMPLLLFQQNSFKQLFEKQEIEFTSAETMFQELLKLCGIKLTKGQFTQCWNALLGRINIKHIRLVMELRKKYNVVLLSNTNNIHLEKINSDFAEDYGMTELSQLFDSAYYSHEVGFRKPQPEIYQLVLNDFPSSAYYFFDDKLENIKAAQDLGIDSYQVKQSVIELVKQLKL